MDKEVKIVYLDEKGWTVFRFPCWDGGHYYKDNFGNTFFSNYSRRKEAEIMVKLLNKEGRGEAFIGPMLPIGKSNTPWKRKHHVGVWIRRFVL